MFGFKKLRRRRLMRQPISDEWLTIIRQNVPYHNCLPHDKQKQLQGLVQIFLDEKLFEGCGGLKLNDEIKVTIAAQACILILGNTDHLYPGLRSILVYPHKYMARFRQHAAGGVIKEGMQSRLGESWSRGHIVLAWDAVKHGASDIHDGHNLVFHEFAHQLDNEFEATGQVEDPGDNSAYLSWARVLGREYRGFVNDLEHHHQTLLDAYGAASLAEFFAVTTEYFFEKPQQLRQRHPDLYEQLKKFYRQDPADYLNSDK